MSLRPLDPIRSRHDLNQQTIDKIIERVNLLCKISSSGGIVATLDQTGLSIRNLKQAAAGGGGFPFPDGRVYLVNGTYTLVKATHGSKWLWIDSESWGNMDITMPANPVVGDAYFFHGFSVGSYYVKIRPNTGQTIVMPSEDVDDTQYINYGTTAPAYGHHTYFLICSAANTWACWYSTASVIV